MWIVAKYNTKELGLLKRDFKKSLGDSVRFYIPKIKYQKKIKNKLKYCEKFILEGYLFCYDFKFQNQTILNSLKYTKGLKYFLQNSKNDQKQITSFLDYCKKFENKEGYITQGFFNDKNIKKVKFLEGPFANMVFDIISKNKDNLRILIGSIETIIKKDTYLYCSA